MKKWFLLLIGLGVFFEVKAQNASINFGTELLFPSGNSTNRSGFGVGLGAAFDLPMSSRFSLSAAAGYNGFIGRKYFGYRTPMIDALPVKLGVKYFTSNDFYFEGQFGLAINSAASYNSMIFTPGIGSYLRFRGVNQRINVGLRYETWTMPRVQVGGNSLRTNFNFIALRAGFVWGR